MFFLNQKSLHSPTVSKDMDTYVRKEPLGVCASIAPFNFPAYVIRHKIRCHLKIFLFYSMIPLWTIPMALATGNTLILKPSERDPGAAMIIAELCQRAGTKLLPQCSRVSHSTMSRFARWSFECDTWWGSNSKCDLQRARDQGNQCRWRRSCWKTYLWEVWNQHFWIQLRILTAVAVVPRTANESK